MKLRLYLLSIFIPIFSYADCIIHQGGVFDDLIFKFFKQLTIWGDYSQHLSNTIFMILFGCEFIWQLTIKKVFAGDIEKIWVFFFTRVCLGFFFAHYFTNITFYREIIEFFINFGCKISGLDFKSANQVGGSILNDMSPSGLMGYFTCTLDLFHFAGETTGMVTYIVTKIVLALTEVLLFVVMVLISYQIIELYIKTYFLLYAGFILSGFAGSSWTFNYWQRYFQQVIAMGVEFLMMCILLGMLKYNALDWQHKIVANMNLQNMVMYIFNIVGISLLFERLMHTLPQWASNKLAGEIRLKMDDKLTAVSSFMAGK
jgi:P-type conjugative transfer protein TrbL